MKVIECRVGESVFAFELESIKGAIQTVLLNKYMGQNRYTLGYFIYRGDNIQLLDITKILKGKYGKNYENQIIVMIKNESVAFLVDEVRNIIEFESKFIKKPNKNLPNLTYIKYVLGENNLPVYDVKKILDKILGKKGRKNGK